MDIKTISVENLKSLGFDFINQISQAQQNLQAIQAELQLRAQETAKPTQEFGEETIEA